MILDHIDPLEDALTQRSFPALSPWWRSTLERFYVSGKRQLVLRVGRRGGKSSSLCRVAVLEALYGDHNIPAGDVGVVAIVSVSRDEATSRLRTIRAILDAIGVAYKPIEGGIELLSKPVIFKVFAASISGVSGFTAVCVIADEVAKWKDSDTGSNPAREVLASIRPTMATQANARIFLSSSPLSKLDAHYEAFERGDAVDQMVAHAPTWVANPSISEADTLTLEPNDRTRRREYAAIPSEAESAAFDRDAVLAAFEPRPDIYTKATAVLVIDASSGRKDAFTAALVRWIWDDKTRYYTFYDGRPRPCPWGPGLWEKDEWKAPPALLEFSEIASTEGAFWKTTRADEIVRKHAQTCKRVGAYRVFGDQREALSLESLYRNEGLKYESLAWSQPTKVAAVDMLRRLLAEKRVVFPESADKMKKELLAYEERWTSAGNAIYAARGGGHDDFAALVLTALMADAVVGLPRSPNKLEPARGMGQTNFQP